MRLTKEHFQFILSKILKNSNEVLIVNFGFDELAPENIAQLVATLNDNNCVHTLDLCANFLQTESISFLASYFTTHHSIESLKLAGNEMGDSNAKLLLEALANNCGLKTLDLKDNDLTDELIPNISQLLKQNTSLQLINLTFNKFSKEGIQELIKLTNIHCLLQLDTKNRDYLRIVKATKYKVKLLFRLQVYIRYVLHDNQNYSGAAKRAKKSNLWQIIGHSFQDLTDNINGADTWLAFFIQLISSSAQTDEFCEPADFIALCMERSDLTNMLLHEAISLPDGKTRDQILFTIGNAMFCNEIYSYQSMLNLINSHICFLNISDETEYRNRMALESYRALVSAPGLVEGNERDLIYWKQWYKTNTLPFNFNGILEKIDKTIDNQQKNLQKSPILPPENNQELLMFLFAHRTKTAALRKISSTGPELITSMRFSM